MFGLFSSSKTRAEARAYAEELRRQIRRGTREGSNRFYDLRDTAYDQAHRWGSQLDDGRRKAQELSIQGARNIDEHAHENPWTYVAAGTAVGLVVGFLIGRR